MRSMNAGVMTGMHHIFSRHGLIPRFFSRFQSATVEISRTFPSSIICFCRSSSVQWCVPSGGSEQARATRCASAFSSSFEGCPGRGAS
jgi:hypothetical protein